LLLLNPLLPSSS